MSIILDQSLAPVSKKLRRHFETVTADRNDPDRFQWDWFHLPGRYNHLRTPAEKFFPERLHIELADRLRAFGRTQLGCKDISPIWLSNYVDGCEQRLHADRPHGPWAFVLALTPSRPRYEGGETMFIAEKILNFWSNAGETGHAFEEPDILKRVPTRFGRLLVFDPRIPHGVTRVAGAQDPLHGRLVVHGWFTPPQPFVEGPVHSRQAEASLAAFDQALANQWPSTFIAAGTAAYRIEIKPDGRVSKIISLASSLRSSDPRQTKRDAAHLEKVVRTHFMSCRFNKAKGRRSLTLPLTIGHAQ